MDLPWNFEFIDEFCSSKLWEPNTTLSYTLLPSFTTCFRCTVMTWIPLLIFVIFCYLEILYWKNKHHKIIQWNVLSISKMVMTTSLAFISAIKAMMIWLHSTSSGTVSTAIMTAPIIKLLTYSLVAAYEIKRRKLGIGSSLTLALFWFIEFIFGLINYHSNIIDLMLKPSPSTIHFILIDFLKYSIVMTRFFTAFKADMIEDSYYFKSKKRNNCPEFRSSIFSRLTFSWVYPTMKSSFDSPLRQESLWNLDSDNTSEVIVNKFDFYWKREINKIYGRAAKSSRVGVSVLNPLVRCFWLPITALMVLKLLASFIKLAKPVILGLSIKYAAKEEPLWKGFTCSIFLFLMLEILSVILNWHNFIRNVIEMKWKTILTSKIYIKALNMSNEERQNTSIGKIINLISIDMQNILKIPSLLVIMTSCPLEILLYIYVLYQYVGVASFGGLFVLILVIPFSTSASLMLRKLQSENISWKDRRMKLVTEMLNGIKTIKCYLWEIPFKRKLQQCRSEEIKALKSIAYYRAGVDLMWNWSPFFMSLVCFGVFIFSSNTEIVTSEMAFVSLNLFLMLRTPVNVVATIPRLLFKIKLSLERIDNLLFCSNIDVHISKLNEQSGDKAIIMKNASFSWHSEGNENILKNIDLVIPKGNLVAIVGQVGSGKSSLISAILGEMKKNNGSIRVQGLFAYVPQVAWIQNSNIRENIIMFNTFNVKKYAKIIEACALNPDLRSLANGDKTEIGEKGANLSGGQKQRVSLARSVYHNADIYLLDDPLNAVDAHVGKYLFETVIGRTGLLKHKTRIFVTNNVNHLSQCDSIIVMSKGKIVQHTSFSKMIEMDSKVTNFCWPDNHTTQANGEFEKTTVYSSRKKTQDFNENCKEGPENHKFKRNVIVTYIRKMGINFAMLLAILYATAEILDTFKDMSLSHWSKQSSSENVSYWLYIKMFFMYAVIGILQGCAIFFSSYALSYGALKASIELHKMLLNCIMRSPISFFHKTPIGQITQRFSKDISVLDTDFVASLNLWLILLSRLVSIFFIAIKMLPFMMIIILPMIWLFWLIQLFHYRSSRNFTILECNTKSSIDSFFSESVIGASSIRAYDLSQNFIESLHRKIDENTKSCYISAIAIRWVTMRLEILTNCVICLVAMFMIMNKEKFSAGEIGLAISNILALTTCLTTFVSETSFVQNNIVSIERLLDYCYLPSEASLKNDFDNIHTNWPTSGSITFSNYFTKYGNGLKTALNNINFKIKSREKIGICGRTGAGKSTLSLALLRLIEGSSGKIFIDGVDISQLGLQKLRSSITIIPQSQILFNGTLRENLDPFQDHDDDSLWAVLKHVHMMEFFRKQDSGLEFLIGEMGSNLSVGQCQLLCLARAMLKKSKILILDEATAGIDTETDNLIQETIRSEFDQCTVLVIAHRLNSIMDCSRVLVLDNGEIAEFDTVDNLLKSKKLFYELTVDAGIIK